MLSYIITDVDFPPSLYLQETTQRRDIAGLPVIHEINRQTCDRG